MRCDGFKVSPVNLPTGRTVWAVSGTVNGSQIRRRFPTAAEAEAFRDQHDGILFGKGPSKPPVRTHLADAEVQEAEAATALLKEAHPTATLFDAVRFYHALFPVLGAESISTISGILSRLKETHPSRTLVDAIDFYLTHYRASVSDIQLRPALMDYLLERQREHEKRSLGARQFNSIGFELARLEKYFAAEKPLSSITGIELHEYLMKTFPTDDSGTPSYSNKSWNNRRGLLTTFFNYCIQRGWLTENPAQRVRVFRRNQLAQGEVAILSAAQAAELMAYVETFQNGRLVPFFAITLFAGVRPDWQHGEISKLTVDNFILDEKYLRLPRAITKTKKKRHTVLQANLLKWLERFPLKDHPIICANFKKLYPRVRKKFSLKHDVLRHTYCSMLVGKYRSVAETALQAGNSEQVLWESYLDLVPKAEAETFWNISPTTTASAPQHLLEEPVPSTH